MATTINPSITSLSAIDRLEIALLVIRNIDNLSATPKLAGNIGAAMAITYPDANADTDEKKAQLALDGVSQYLADIIAMGTAAASRVSYQTTEQAAIAAAQSGA